MQMRFKAIVYLVPLLVVASGVLAEPEMRWWELNPSRVDYDAAVKLHNKGLSSLHASDQKAALTALLEAANLGLPPSGEELANILKHIEPEAAYYWASIAARLSQLKLWEHRGLTISAWGEQEAIRVHALRDMIGNKISDGNARQIVDLSVDLWVKKHNAILLEEEIDMYEQDRNTPALMKAREAIDSLFGYGIGGAVCSKEGKLLECTRVNKFSPPLHASECLAYLRKGGYSDPCPAITNKPAYSLSKQPNPHTDPERLPALTDGKLPVRASNRIEIGSAVSIYENTAMLGSPRDLQLGPFSGCVYVLTRTKEGWAQTVKLTAKDGGEGDLFGRSVAISGTTALVGAPSAQGAATKSGAVYVFNYDGKTWNQGAKLLASTGKKGDNFGWSVSVSSDHALVGAPGAGKPPDNIHAGAVYVFARGKSGWYQVDTLFPADQHPRDSFGHSVAISDEVAIIGSNNGRDNGQTIGSAYVFENISGRWRQVDKLIAKDTVGGDEYGKSVSVWGDTAVVGAPTIFGEHAGAAYVFRRLNGSWQQETKLVASDRSAGDRFGQSVSIYSDRIVVGASFDPSMLRGFPPGTGKGPTLTSAYVFDRESQHWTQSVKLTPRDRKEGDLFGWSVSISRDTVLIGAPGDDTTGSDTGTAYVFHP